MSVSLVTFKLLWRGLQPSNATKNIYSTYEFLFTESSDVVEYVSYAKFWHNNFADLALWLNTYSYITKETVFKKTLYIHFEAK